jgi:hypothetical protein
LRYDECKSYGYRNLMQKQGAITWEEADYIFPWHLWNQNSQRRLEFIASEEELFNQVEAISQFYYFIEDYFEHYEESDDDPQKIN